jgi:regulator of protease activity HflC (stomatin/prohibitin superfamily)
VCASRSLDAILVARPGTGGADPASISRESFRADLMREANRRLDTLATQGAGLGVRISRIDVSAALPGGAKAAFDRVLQATQTAETAIADARTAAARTAAATREQRLRILADADAQAVERVTEARATASLMDGFASLGQGGDASAAAQRRTLYNTRAGALLTRAHEVDAVDPDAGARLLLPGPGASR